MQTQGGVDRDTRLAGRKRGIISVCLCFARGLTLALVGQRG
jgi:hypothetical protein